MLGFVAEWLGRGARLPRSVPLAAKGHRIDIDTDGTIVVEWYDHGDAVPYESANMLIFGEAARARLAAALALSAGAGPDRIAATLARRFDSYFAIRRFADESGVTYEHRVDFMP